MACRELGINIRTWQRWFKGAKRKKPTAALSEEERLIAMENAEGTEFYECDSGPPARIAVTLVDKGEQASSESTFYRLPLEKNLPPGGKVKRSSRKTSTSYAAAAPNQVWFRDIVWMISPVRGKCYFLYMLVDMFSRHMVGWEIREEESAQYAKTLVQKAYFKEMIWKYENAPALRLDNGSSLKASAFGAALKKTGLSGSYGRPRVGDGNAYSESLFRTFKYRLGYPIRGFESLEAAREWVYSLVNREDGIHCRSALNHVAPEQCRTGEFAVMIKAKKAIWGELKRKRPERWSDRLLRNWEEENVVWIDSERDETVREFLPRIVDRLAEKNSK